MTTVLRLLARTGRGSRSATQLSDVNAELGTATVEWTSVRSRRRLLPLLARPGLRRVLLWARSWRSAYLAWTSVPQTATST